MLSNKAMPSGLAPRISASLIHDPMSQYSSRGLVMRKDIVDSRGVWDCLLIGPLHEDRGKFVCTHVRVSSSSSVDEIPVEDLGPHVRILKKATNRN